MKLIYHIVIMGILFFTIPGLFYLGIIYWGFEIGFKVLCIIIKPLIKLGLINTTHHDPVINNKETWTEEKDRLERERLHRQYQLEQTKRNEAIAESYKI